MVMGWKDAVIMDSLIKDHRFSFHRVPAIITTWQENEGELLLEFFRHFGYVRLWVPGELLLLPRGGCRSGWCCERGRRFFGKSCFWSLIVCVRTLDIHHTPHASTWQPNVLPLETDPHPDSPLSSFWWILGVAFIHDASSNHHVCMFGLRSSFSDVVFCTCVCVVGQWYVPRCMILEPSPSETPRPLPSSSIKVWKPWKPGRQGSI